MEHMEVSAILDEMEKLYPDAHCELNHRNAYEMAVAVILSAQTTDASVNKVTPELFTKYPTIDSLAEGDLKEIEQYISSLGLYHNKAKSIQGFAKGVVENYHGVIPQTMDDLTTLPGVGRKCANVIQSECFNLPSLAVDTHVSRVSKRLGLAYQKDEPEAIERKLKRKIPQERWVKTHHQMIFFGRYLCHAQRPECWRCPFVEICHEKKKNFTDR
jgi:endonuclease III